MLSNNMCDTIYYDSLGYDYFVNNGNGTQTLREKLIEQNVYVIPDVDVVQNVYVIPDVIQKAEPSCIDSIFDCIFDCIFDTIKRCFYNNTIENNTIKKRIIIDSEENILEYIAY